MTIDSVQSCATSAAPARDGLRPIFLVGMMGAGKTTIGRQLAVALGREFLDLDQAIETRCGVRIATIFDIEGEAGFRRRETAVLRQYARQPGLVLATGGGAVLAAENRQLLKESGCVIYLRAGVDDLYQRVARDRNRPLLHTPDPRGRLADLLAQREALYAEVADITIDTVDQPVAQVVRAILPAVQSFQFS